MKVFFSESYKLRFDKQFWVCSIILWIYSAFGFLTSVNQESFYHADSIQKFLENYTDPIVLLILVGIIAPTVFGMEYSYHMYKNIVPFISKRKIFGAKYVTMLAASAFVLFVNMLVELTAAGIVIRRMPSIKDFLYLLLRYVNTYFVVTLLLSVLVFLTIVIRIRAIGNILIVIVSFALSIIPAVIKSGTIWDYWQKSMEWGNVLDYSIMVLLVIMSAICFVISNFLFERQEVNL